MAIVKTFFIKQIHADQNNKYFKSSILKSNVLFMQSLPTTLMTFSNKDVI